ncbi:MAG: AAA family ATPase [Chitinophagales bacterium]
MITVLSGINGSGKTTVLDFIYDTFKKQNITLANAESFIHIEAELFSKNFKENYKLTSSFLKQNKSHFRFPLSKKIIYYKASKENELAKKSIIDFIDFLIYEKDVRSSEAYAVLQTKINEILANLQLDIAFSGLDKKKEIYFKNAHSNRIKLQDLSSGEKAIITKVLPLYLADVKDSLILIDEPEDSLHPNWQNEIVGLYRKVAERNNNQFIIATHSPHIVGAVRQECVKILKKEEDVIKVIDSSTKSYGKRIDEVLLEIFGLKALRTPVVEQKIDALSEMLNENNFENENFENLLKELEETLGRFDSDLAMIRMEKMKRKVLR